MERGTSLARVLLLGALLAHPLAAGLVSFEGLADLEPVTNQFGGLGVQFVNATVLSAGQSLNEVDHPPSSGLNVAFDDGGPVSLYFSSAMTDFEAWVTFTTQVTLLAFDNADLLIGATSTLASSNLGTRERIGISVAGIRRVDLIGDFAGASFTFDDPAFLARAPVFVPEPSFPGMVVLATGLFAAARRRGR